MAPKKLNFALTLLFLGFLVLAASFSACRKEKIIDENPALTLSFSTDTVIFDTVFTSLGSATHNVRVYNKNENSVRITSIRLAGGSGSSYRINIDGEPVLSAENIDLAPDDSLYIFVRVTIDPTLQSSPFIVSDSIVFETNGNIQDVDLVAWGQNANYILADTYIQGFPKFKIIAGETEEVTWTKEKPYVVYGYAVVDSTGRLNIEAGTRVHFHDRSGLWVYKGGTLKVNGTLEEKVTFQGDRLEAFYEDLPGQWDRIWINEGATDNEIHHAVIKNGFIGLQAETLQQQMGNQLIVTNTVIENMSGLGILSRFYNITANNIVVVNCGQYLAALTWGGIYDFRHCTFGNDWVYSVRPTPSVFLNNYFTDQEGNIVTFGFDAYFGNSIIYGRNKEEMEFLFDPSSQFDFYFDHCLLKTELETDDPDHYRSILLNADPLFKDPVAGNYQPDTLSPVIDRGSMEVIDQSPLDVTHDILNVARTGSPDLGAYEFVPGGR